MLFRSVCHLDEKGRLSAFERVYADYGRAIEKVYRFATEHFGGYDRLKSMRSDGMTGKLCSSASFLACFMVSPQKSSRESSESCIGSGLSCFVIVIGGSTAPLSPQRSIVMWNRTAATGK